MNKKNISLKNEVKAVGKHSLIYVVGTALSRAVGFIMLPVYTHYIAPDSYGGMELIEIISAAVALLIAMGVSDSMPRFYYEENELKKKNEVVSTIIIGLGLLGIPIVVVLLFLAGPLSILIIGSLKYRLIIQLSFITAWFGLFYEICTSYCRMKYMAKLFVSITTVQLIIALSLNILFVVYYQLDIFGIFYSIIISRGIVSTVVLLIILKKIGVQFSKKRLAKMIKFGFPLVPSRIGLMLGFISNRFFLRWMGSPDPAVALFEIGLFSLGHKFGVIVNRFVNTPFYSFWGPRRIELLVNENDDSKIIVTRICTYAITGSLFMALLLSLNIDSIISIIVDSRYKDAGIIVPYIALSYVFLALDTHFATGIIIQKKTKLTFYITLCSLAVIIICNYIFIPLFSITGAAISTLAGFFIRMLLTYFTSQRLFYMPFEIKRLSMVFALAIVTYIISRKVNCDSIYLSFLINNCFGLLFIVLLIICGFFRKDEYLIIKKFMYKFYNKLKKNPI